MEANNFLDLIGFGFSNLFTQENSLYVNFDHAFARRPTLGPSNPRLC